MLLVSCQLGHAAERWLLGRRRKGHRRGRHAPLLNAPLPFKFTTSIHYCIHALTDRRLFGRLWDRGLVLVATSNRAPDALYEGGLQRHLFLPFIARLKTACMAHDMASTVDYRRLAHHANGCAVGSRLRGLHVTCACVEVGGVLWRRSMWQHFAVIGTISAIAWRPFATYRTTSSFHTTTPLTLLHMFARIYQAVLHWDRQGAAAGPRL